MSNFFSEHHHHTSEGERSVDHAQQLLFSYLIEAVKAWPPADVLKEFKHLFIDYADTLNTRGATALQIILFANDEQEFKNTLKRCCYILVNNWEVAREHDAIQKLVKLFQDPCLQRRSLSPTLKRLRQWVNNFIRSPDYEELRLFALRLAEERTLNSPDSWAARYTPYLLVPQYTNADNPLEQRQAARAMARRLKDKFKLDLALYTAHSPATLENGHAPPNPTALGSSALRLIKAIVAHQGKFSYRNLARLFLSQVQQLPYRRFKKSLVRYLIFQVKPHPAASQLKTSLREHLETTYCDQDEQPLDYSRVLLTCNRVIDLLTTEDRQTPSTLFTLMMSQGHALTLAVVLLKLVLIAPNSQQYLEARIAELIRYYELMPQHECQWVINFLEIFRVVFTLYTENVSYSLIDVSPASGGTEQPLSPERLESLRIFSQVTLPTFQLLEPEGSPGQELGS